MPGPLITRTLEHLASQKSGDAPEFLMDEVVPYLVGHTLDEVERELILHTLLRHRGNRTHSARILGISIRCLRIKCHDYEVLGIAVPASGQPAVSVAH